MPIYEYRCDNCGHELEAFQKHSEAPLQTCPECQTESLRKKISATAFRLKGGGWYETDFKSGNKKNVAGAENSSADNSKSSGGDSAGSSDKKSSSSSSSSSASSSSDSGS
ncbi:MAG: zinc ribbon domain-containing protein [Pseudomonadota bacterium]